MKELKEAVFFAISLVEAGFASLEDGKFDFTDAMKLWGPMRLAGDAVDGASKILGEIKALTPESKASLMAEVKAEFDIDDDVLEAKIEGAIQLSLGVAMYAATFLKKS